MTNRLSDNRCPLCDSPAVHRPIPNGGDGDSVQCPNCGEFAITRTALAALTSLSDVVRENQPLRLEENSRWHESVSG